MSDAEELIRLRKRLALVCDPEQPDRIRFCAVRAIQRSLPYDHALGYRDAADLMDEVLPTWATRPYRNTRLGRGTLQLPVTRPPLQLSDVWDY